MFLEQKQKTEIREAGTFLSENTRIEKQKEQNYEVKWKGQHIFSAQIATLIVIGWEHMKEA